MKNKKLFHRDVLFTTILTFVIIGLLSLLFYNTKFLNPIYNSLKDFEISDIYYSAHRSKTNEYSDQIVIVNIGESDRKLIADALELIEKENPKVIGIDISFPDLKNDSIDLKLKNSLYKDNVILASQIEYSEEKESKTQRSQQRSNRFFQVESKEGFGNFIGDVNSTVRYYCPSFMDEEGNQVHSFTSKIAQKFNPKKYEILKERNHKTEIINFGLKKYLVIEMTDLFLDANLVQLVNGKCVLLGYMGNPEGPKVLDDLHVTPLNKNFGGVSIPDTYGVEIHADILSMVFNNQYINESSAFTKWFVIVLLCILHLYLFAYFYVKKHLWFHIVAKSAQIVSFGLLSFLTIGFYHWFNYKLEPTVLLIAVILSVDALYFMEGIMVYLNKRKGINSYFISNHH